MMALVPSTSSQKPPPTSSSICALINDRDNSLLNGLVDRLGSLEDGALIPVEENIQKMDGIRHYQFRLDTKYYVANVPVYTFPTFEALLNLMKSTTEQIQINALIICATRNELKTEFLARISQYNRELNLDCAEVKSLVLKDDGLAMDKEPLVMDLVNDAQLQNFCIHKSIELIPLQNSSNTAADKNIEDNEEGTTGLARVLEILETVRWPGMWMKPNPLGRAAHFNRLRQFIQQQEEEDEFNGFEIEDLMHHNSKLVNGEMPAGNDYIKNKQKLAPHPHLNLDYPDSDDEAAIMEWFDNTENDGMELRNSNSTANKEKEERRIAHNNASLNFVNENAAEENGGINEDMCHELMQNITSKDPFQLKSILGSINTIRQQNNWPTASRGERIAASEGLTYSVLGAISPTIVHQSQQSPKKQGTAMEQGGTESTEMGSNSNTKVKKKKNN